MEERRAIDAEVDEALAEVRIGDMEIVEFNIKLYVIQILV
jgi:hypothetical protein